MLSGSLERGMESQAGPGASSAQTDGPSKPWQAALAAAGSAGKMMVSQHPGFLQGRGRATFSCLSPGSSPPPHNPRGQVWAGHPPANTALGDLFHCGCGPSFEGGWEVAVSSGTLVQLGPGRSSSQGQPLA